MAGFIGAGALAGNATVAPQALASHASTAVGDILIAQIINKSVTANAVSPPDGTWTKLVEATNNALTAAHKHQYTIFWKRATLAGAQSYTFTKATDDNVLFAGVLSTWRNIGIDATTPVATATTGAADNVTFPAFDPTDASTHVIFFAFYGLNATTFGIMGGSNPTSTTRYDLESATGTTCTLAASSGDSTGAAIGSRTWASVSTTDAGNTGVVLALTTLETVPVTQATVTAAGKTVTVGDLEVTPVTNGAVSFAGKTVTIRETEVTPVLKASVTYTGKTVTVRESEVTPVTKATVTVAGQTVTIPADIVPSTPDDVRFSSTRTRLNVRRGLLYRSLHSAAPIVSSADIVTVTPATVTFTGKPVLVFDLEPITRASVTFTGQTVSIGDSTLPGNNDVQFASTRTRLNVRRGLLYRSLTAPVLPEIAAPPLQPDILFPSQEQTIFGRWTLLYRPLTVPARPPAVTDTVPITNGQISLIGKSVSETETIPLNKATVTVSGKTVTVRDAEVTPVAKATVTFAGKTILGLETVPINKGTVVFACQTIATIDPGVDRITVEKADILFTGKGVFEREVLVTQGSVVFTGKPITELEITSTLKATVLFTGKTVTPTDFAGEAIPVGPATILFSGQTVTVTDTGEIPIQPPLGGGGVYVPSWIDYGRKKRRRYRALEEIERRLDKRIETLKAETKEKQQQVAEVISQPGQIDVLSQQFADLLRQQALITGMLLEAQRRAEAVRQERIQLAILAQRAAEAIDEEEAITMLLLT